LNGVGPKTIEKIEAHGVTTVEKLADMTPEQLTAIPGIGEKMVEKIQLAVAAHFQSIEQQQAAEAAQPAEPEEQPGEAEQVVASEEAVPEGPAPEKLDAAPEQNTEGNQETLPHAAPDQVEVSPEKLGASEDETVEREEKSTEE